MHYITFECITLQSLKIAAIIAAMDAEARKKAARRRRSESILDAAESLVFEKGFSAVTMDDVAKAAGYAKRSVYLYFADRDELFFALVKRGQSLLLETLKAAAERASGPDGAIRSFGEAYYRFSIDRSGYFALLMDYESDRHEYGKGRVAEETAHDACQNLSVEYGTLLADAIASDIASGRLGSDLDAFATMMLLWGQMFGVMKILLMRLERFEEVYGVGRDEFFQSFIARLEAAYAADSRDGPVGWSGRSKPA